MKAAVMDLTLKTPEQIERMRRAGRIVRLALEALREMIAPGVTTGALDARAERICLESGARCLFKNYSVPREPFAFPASICASVNEEVVHGIPSGRAIRDGDIVSVDFGVKLDGWCGDAAETYLVGNVPQQTRRLVEVTRNALAMAVGMIRPGGRWSDVARAVQGYVESEGFSVVRDFVGHGIGMDMHEPPQVPNFVSRELELNDIELVPGLVLAIEPMVNMGGYKVERLKSGWTVVTRDRKPSAHFEHTVAVTDSGVTVLTE